MTPRLFPAAPALRPLSHLRRGETRGLLSVLVTAGLFMSVGASVMGCDKKPEVKPDPTPSTTVAATSAPTPSPTGTASSVAAGPSGSVSGFAPTLPIIPVVELPGVDTTALTATEKQSYSRLVGDMLAPCPELPVSLATCVKEKRACAKCLPAAQAIARGVHEGEEPQTIRDWLEVRFDDKKMKAIDVTGNPAIGPEGAPITMVEFADFECPHCAMMAPVLHALLDEPDIKPKVRFVFKNYPLPMHEFAEPAARAASAAQALGKFWEMHDQLFTHQSALKPADIEGYAVKIGLTLTAFRAEYTSPRPKARVDLDVALGKAAGVMGTPNIWINNRQLRSLGKTDINEQIRQWIALEMTLPKPPAPPPLDLTPPPAPSGSASVAGSGSAAKPGVPPPSSAGSASAAPPKPPVMRPPG